MHFSLFLLQAMIHEEITMNLNAIARFGCIAALVVTLAGCQSKLLSVEGKLVAEENRIALPSEGSASGSWQGKTDLVVEYSVSRMAEALQMAGEIVFRRQKLLNNFQCSVVLIGGNGTVLKVAGIATASGLEETERIPFSHEIQLPPATRFFAFSYSGTSRGRGNSGSPNSFWSAPW
jgi:hypothetical protein